MKKILKKVNEFIATASEGKKAKESLDSFLIVKDRIVSFIDSYKYGRIVVFCTTMMIIMVGYSWCNNPSALHIKVYDAMGSSSKLCELYEWANFKNNSKNEQSYTDVMGKTVEALSKFTNQDSMVFLGEKLIDFSTSDELKTTIISELKNNNRNALNNIVSHYGEQKDTKALINLFKEYVKDKELNSESYKCIDLLASINDTAAGEFLDSIMISSEFDNVVKDEVVKAYEKSDENAINQRIDAFYKKVISSEVFPLKEGSVLEIYGQYDNYKSKVANVLFRAALIGLEPIDVDNNLKLIEIARKYAEPSKTSIYNVIQNLCDILIIEGEKYKEAIANRDKRDKELQAEIAEAETVLKNKLAQKDERLKELRLFFNVTVPMWESPEHRQYLVYNFGLQAALESIRKYNQTYLENLNEYDEIFADYPRLKQKINTLKTQKDEKLSSYNIEVKKNKVNYETVIKKIKIFSKEEHYLDDVVAPTSVKQLTNALGLFLDESISIQPVKYEFKNRSGWSVYYNCVNIDELRLEDVVPVDKIKINSAILNSRRNEELVVIMLETKGDSRDIVRYLTENYGFPYSMSYMWAWESGEFLMRYREYDSASGLIEIMTKDFYNYLVKNNL